MASQPFPGPEPHDVPARKLVSVTQDEASLDVLWAKTQQSCCRIRREGKEGFLGLGKAKGRAEEDRGYWEERSSDHVFCTRLLASLWRLPRGRGWWFWWFVEKGGACMPWKVGFLRQSRGPLVAQLTRRHGWESRVGPCFLPDHCQHMRRPVLFAPALATEDKRRLLTRRLEGNGPKPLGQPERCAS